jgi:CubicO group peptidase (beta-lactamase class C family)
MTDRCSPGIQRLMQACLVVMLVVGAACPTAVEATAPDARARYDAAVDDAIARYQLPGIAVGVIDEGEVVYLRVAGETVAGSGEPVTPATLFKIASNSKAMTAAVLARLVQAGRLRWDDPVAKHLPWFAMHDPWVTRHMTVRDLLVHNSGLPEGGGDLMLWPEPNHFSREDIIRGLRHIPPAYGFRAGYAYDNLLYVVAGEVAAAAGGASYESLVRSEVFDPLGLDDCRVGEFDRSGLSVAQPHYRDHGRNVAYRIDPQVVPAISSAPAGGIRCSLADMLSWARNWLVPTAAQLVWLGTEQRARMWEAVTPMPVSRRAREWNRTRYYAYALGFRLADVDGQWTVSHTGTLGGMYSVMTLLPDLRSGFVILVNGDAGQARTVLGQVLLKHFTAPGEPATIDGYAALIAAEPSGGDIPEPDTSSRRSVAPGDLADWLGSWRDPWLGEARICTAEDRVEFSVAKSPRLSGVVMRVGERLLVDWHDDGVGVEPWLEFSRDGDTRRLAMAKVDPDGDFSSDFEDLAFVRTGDCTG